MRLNTKSLRSKVARRIFALFIACALLPIGALAVISMVTVTAQLDEQNRVRLVQASKAHGMAIYDRLRSAEASLAMAAQTLELDADITELGNSLSERFDSLQVVTDDGLERTLMGEPFHRASLTAGERTFLDDGGALVSSVAEVGAEPQVDMSIRLDSAVTPSRRLVGMITPAYLWGADGLPTVVAFTVRDASGSVIASSTPVTDSLRERLGVQLSDATSGALEWSGGSVEYLAGFWTLFLKPRFHNPGWTIVLSEPLDLVQGPIASFRRSFVWIALLSVGVITLLSLIQIRRNMVPLEALREGTRRIADQDFDVRVFVTTNDEFKDLAESFNGMAGHLGKQFSALKTINEIDKAVLSQLHAKDIAETALAWMGALVPCEELCIGLLDEAGVKARRPRSFGPRPVGPQRRNG